MTATAHTSGDALDGERLLIQIRGARDHDEQLWSLHRAIEAAVLPVDVHVVGEPLVLVAVEYDGNARRGLVARCRREDGGEHRIVADHIVTVAPNKHWRHAGHPYLDPG